MVDLSIIIPAYHEALRLTKTLIELKEFLGKSGLSNEIILVVEPSDDNTIEIAQNWALQEPTVKVIENEERLGKGGSVRQGVLHARGECIAFIDADGATGLSFLANGYELIKKDMFDVVIASRGVKESVLVQKQSVFRVFLGFCFRWITRKFIGLPYKDTQCGAKLFHYKTIKPLFSELIEYGFAFDVEILLKAQYQGITVKEIPCTWKDIDGSKVNPIFDGWKMIRAITRIKKYYQGIWRDDYARGDLYSDGESGKSSLVVQGSSGYYSQVAKKV